MRSTLEVYTQQYANQITPETKQILVQLADHMLRLVRKAYETDLEREGLTQDTLSNLNDSDFRARLRRNEPALNSLSDEELDVAFNITQHLNAEGHAAGECYAERHEYMTAEERERMSIIASWAL